MKRQQRWPSASQGKKPEEKPSRQYLNLTLPASRTGGNKFLLFNPPGLWHVAMAAQANRHTIFTIS